MLYHIQDSDRPAYVLAKSYTSAVHQWKCVIARENEIPIEEVDDPQGVNLLTDDPNEVIMNLELLTGNRPYVFPNEHNPSKYPAK